MAVKQRKAGGGSSAGGGESPYTELERALKEVYEAARGLRQGQRGRRKRLERRVEPPELGDLFVKVYTKQYGTGERAAIFKVFKRDYLDPFCSVWLEFEDGEPLLVDVDCEKLEELASRCARGRGCVLSWEEARTALELAVWAASRLAGLAGIPAKMERAGLVEAHDTWDGKPSVLPCLQVSMNGKSYSVCKGVLLFRDPNRGWKVESIYRLVPIGKHAKMVEALMELRKMVEEYVENREREGAKSTRVRKHRGKFLELEKVVLRRRDGTEEVLLKLWLPWLYRIGEGFAVVYCPDSYMESSDGELAAMIKKELEEALGVVVQAGRRYTEEHDPRYAALAYIAAEAVSRAGLALA